MVCLENVTLVSVLGEQEVQRKIPRRTCTVGILNHDSGKLLSPSVLRKRCNQRRGSCVEFPPVMTLQVKPDPASQMAPVVESLEDTYCNKSNGQVR